MAREPREKRASSNVFALVFFLVGTGGCARRASSGTAPPLSGVNCVAALEAWPSEAVMVARDCIEVPRYFGLDDVLPRDLDYRVSVAEVFAAKDFHMQFVRAVGSVDAVHAHFRELLAPYAAVPGGIHLATSGATIPPGWPAPLSIGNPKVPEFWWPSLSQEGLDFELAWVQRPDPFNYCENNGASGTAVLKAGEAVYRMEWWSQFHFPWGCEE